MVNPLGPHVIIGGLVHGACGAHNHAATHSRWSHYGDSRIVLADLEKPFFKKLVSKAQKSIWGSIKQT